MFIDNKHHKCSTSILGICLLPIFWNWNTLDYHPLYSITRRFLTMRIRLVYRLSTNRWIYHLRLTLCHWITATTAELPCLQSFFRLDVKAISAANESPERQLLWMDTSERLCHKKGKLNGETIGDWKQSRKKKTAGSMTILGVWPIFRHQMPNRWRHHTFSKLSVGSHKREKTCTLIFWWFTFPSFIFFSGTPVSQAIQVQRAIMCHHCHHLDTTQH